jgi:pentatricopeptide repeat protein
MCQNVLDTAARHGDPQLATHVLNILGARDLIYKLHHYEALLEAYVSSGDVSSAFGVLNVMNKNKIIPETASTRPIFFALQANQEAVQEAWDTLESFSRTQETPIAGVNVVIEAATYLQDPDQVEVLYKALPQICDPNLRTFHILFLHAVQSTNATFAEKLLSDMQTASLTPDTLIIDRLLLLYARKGALSETKQLWEQEVGGPLGVWRLGTYWSAIKLAAMRQNQWAVEALEAARLAFPNEPLLADVDRWVRMVMQGMEDVEEPWIEVEL